MILVNVLWDDLYIFHRETMVSEVIQDHQVLMDHVEAQVPVECQECKV